MEKDKKSKKLEKWELDSKANVLIEAEEIKADRELMKQLMPHLEGKIKRIKSLEDLLDRKREVDEEEEFED